VRGGAQGGDEVRGRAQGGDGARDVKEGGERVPRHDPLASPSRQISQFKRMLWIVTWMPRDINFHRLAITMP
jgi:hypothetical protein